METQKSDFDYYKHSVQQSIVDSSKDSDDEILTKDLSGDEAMEKSFASTLHSSVFQSQNKANIFLSSVTVVKSMVGVGILGIPNVIKNFGMFPSFFIMIFIFICNIFTSKILIKCKNMSHHSNYSSIGFYIFKSKWIIYFVNFLIIFSNMGVCLSEFIIFGTTCENLVQQYGGYEQNNIPWYVSRWFLTILIAIVISPLLVVKNIEKLRFVSLIAIISISTFTIVLIYNFFDNVAKDTLPPRSDLGFWGPKDFDFYQAFAALPTAILAYNWQFNLFPVYKGMQQATDENLIKVSKIGASSATVLYFIVGYTGYASYGPEVQANFLKTIKADEVGDFLYILLNLSFTLSTTLTLPIIFFGSRNNLLQLMNETCLHKPPKQKVQLEFQDDDEQTKLKLELIKKEKQKRKRADDILWYVVSWSVEILIVILAIFLTQLGVVFSFLGSIGANAISYFLPSLYYIKLVQLVKNNICSTEAKKIFLLMVKSYFVYSILLLIICVSSQIFKIIQGGSGGGAH